MDISVTVNLWFVISLCLASALIGTIIGARSVSRSERRSHRYQQLPPLQGQYPDRY